MYPLFLAVALATILLGECVSPQVGAAPPASELPKDGKILVSVAGNARDRGQFWVREDASLATIEDLFAARPEWASRRVFIVRREPEGERHQFRMDKMSRSEKEKVKVHHGDAIFFVWDRCFSSAPNKSVEPNRRPATPFEAARPFDVASCAPPSVSAAVAHL